VVLGRPAAALPVATGGVFPAGELGNDALAAGITSKIVRGGAHDRLGWSIARLGDVDGDGYDDFAVGAPGPGYDDPLAGLVGSVHVFRGHPTYWDRLEDVSLADPALSAHRAALATPFGAKGDRFGYSLSSAGDVDGDGVGDLLVGAPRGDLLDSGASAFPGVVGPGYAALYAGSAVPALPVLLGLVAGEGAMDTFGASVTSLFGDVDGDGIVDLAVGAPGWDAPLGALPDDRGRAYVLSGAGVLASTLQPIGPPKDGESAGDRFGSRVAGNPFFPGSAEIVARLAVAAPFRDRDATAGACGCGTATLDAGQVYVFGAASGALLASYRGESGRDHLGLAVAWIGDVGGPVRGGFADLLCTAPAWPEDPGACAGLPEAGRAYVTLY
jgi:hypothetical protein